MFRTMIFAITALAIVGFSLTGNVFAGTSKFKPRTYRMKTSKPRNMASSFRSNKTHQVKTFKTFRVSKTTRLKTRTMQGSKFRTTTQNRVMKRTFTSVRKRNNVIRLRAPGRKSGFSKEQFNKNSLRRKYVSEKSALDSKF